MNTEQTSKNIFMYEKKKSFIAFIHLKTFQHNGMFL